MSAFPDETVNHMNDMLDSGRQIYGVPGAGLTWGIKGNKGVDIDIGIEGEKMTGAIINEWVSEHENTLAFHSVRCPDLGEADSDHLVVMGASILVIDSKRWMSKRKYSVNAKGDIMRGTVAIPEGKQLTIKPQMKKWREVVPEGVKVIGTVCIAQTEVAVPYDDNWKKAPFRLVTAENLKKNLDYYYKRARADLHLEEDEELPLWEGIHALIFGSRLIKPKETAFMKNLNSKDDSIFGGF